MNDELPAVHETIANRRLAASAAGRI